MVAELRAVPHFKAYNSLIQKNNIFLKFDPLLASYWLKGVEFQNLNNVNVFIKIQYVENGIQFPL